MIAASGSSVYVTFTSNLVSTQVPGGNYEAYVNVNSNFGASNAWSGPINVSGNQQSAREVQVAALGSDVYVTSNGGTAEYISVSTDSGATWGTIPQHIFTGTGKHTYFSTIGIDPSNGHVYVQWGGTTGTTSEIFLSDSVGPPTATSWSTPQQVSSAANSPVVAGGDPGGSQGPFVAASNGHAYVVWEGSSVGNGDIFFAGS
jgi:hypothetical protein